MRASFSGVSRDTDQGVETVVPVSRDLDSSGTYGKESCGLLAKAQASARVVVPTASLPFSSARTMEFDTCVHVFSIRMLGYVLAFQMRRKRWRYEESANL